MLTLVELPPAPRGPEGCTPLSRFACHKSVSAAPIVEVDVMLAVVLVELPDGTRELRHCRPAMFAGQTPHVGDFYVEHDDGHRSISPAAAFLAGYVQDQAVPVMLRVAEGLFTPKQLTKLRRRWEEFCDIPMLRRGQATPAGSGHVE